MFARRQAYLLRLACLALFAVPAPGAQAPAPPAAEEAVVLIRTAHSLRTARGTGFLVGDGSWVVTASHVVAADLGRGRKLGDATALVYSPWTGRPAEARLAALDGNADLALLRLPRGGLPALPLAGLSLRQAEEVAAALENVPLRLYGFPLAYGEDTVPALARPEHSDSRLREVARRGELCFCVLQACPQVQPGWSGGPIVRKDTGAVVAVFHSLYRPRAGEPGYPAGSLTAHVADLLRRAGADPASLAAGAAPAVPRPADARERMALEMRSLSWSAGGNWSKALEEQREIVRLAPDDGLARAELGRLLLELGKDEEALRELREAVRLAPESVLAHLYLGRALHLNFDPKGAAAALQTAIRISPDEIEPRLRLAQVYEENQKPKEAEEVLREAIRRSPEHPVALFRLGALVRRDRPDEGSRLLKQATELSLADPGLSFIPLGHARILDLARKDGEAESLYRLAIRADPQNAHAYYYLALLYLRLGKIEEAQAQLSAGIALPSLSDEMLQAFRALQVRLNEKGGG